MEAPQPSICRTFLGCSCVLPVASALTEPANTLLPVWANSPRGCRMKHHDPDTSWNTPALFMAGFHNLPLASSAFIQTVISLVSMPISNWLCCSIPEHLSNIYPFLLSRPPICTFCELVLHLSSGTGSPFNQANLVPHLPVSRSYLSSLSNWASQTLGKIKKKNFWLKKSLFT